MLDYHTNQLTFDFFPRAHAPVYNLSGRMGARIKMGGREVIWP